MKFTLLLAVVLAASPEQQCPCTKVINLLTDIQGKVNKDGQVEKEQFEAYSEWCRESSSDKEHAIETGTSKTSELKAVLEQAAADINKLKADIDSGATTISQNDKALADATALRSQENTEFTKVESELTQTVDQLVRAASIINKAGHSGSAGTSAQLKAALTQVASGLSTVMDAAIINSDDKQKLASFLESSTEDLDFENPQAAAYESHSTSIIDTLASLKVKAEQELSSLRKDEMAKLHNFQLLRQSLTDQNSVLTRDMKDNQSNLARQQEIHSKANGDLEAASQALSEDKKYLSDLTQMCSAKAALWEQRQASRKEELSVIAKGIEILQGQDVTAAKNRLTEKFASQSFLQASAHSNVRDRVAALLQGAASELHSVGLAQLAARTRSGEDPFEKVRGLISTMITRLMDQAAKESDHKQYCDEETKTSSSKRDKLSGRVDDLATRIDSADASVAQLKEDVSDLSMQVASMDKELAEATSLRQKESKQATQTIADLVIVDQEIANAIALLQEYFQANQDSAKALIQEPQFGGDVFSGKYQASVGGYKGIIGILEVAASDVSRVMAEERINEDQAAKAFTKMKQENEVDRAMKSTSVKAKEGEIARVTNLVADLNSDRAGSQQELDAILEYLSKLKQQCTHTPMPFAERAARRKSEIESLQQALEILEDSLPATTSLLQRNRRTMHK